MVVVVLAGCSAEPRGESGPVAPPTEEVALREFDGGANGTWMRAEPIRSAFPLLVSPDRLQVRRDSSSNQHVVRQGLQMADDRPWELSARVTVETDEPGLNSFCVLFRVGTEPNEPISAHAVNVDLNGGGKAGGVAKYMGFVDGRFESFGQQSFDEGRPGQPFDVRVRVNADDDGSFVPGFARFDVEADGTSIVSVAQDWTAHPWQPPEGDGLGVGFNSHGADWTLENLVVRYLD